MTEHTPPREGYAIVTQGDGITLAFSYAVTREIDEAGLGAYSTYELAWQVAQNDPGPPPPPVDSE